MKRRSFHRPAALGLILSMLLSLLWTGAALAAPALPDGIQTDTPAENVFTLDGRSFILLDTDASVEGGPQYFILAKEFYATRPYTTDGGYADMTQKFDPEVEFAKGSKNVQTLAYWLNHDFISPAVEPGEGELKLPDGVLDHLTERDWQTEAGDPRGNAKEAYTAHCKVVVPSVTELTDYYDKIGLVDDCPIKAQWGWWTRTGRNESWDVSMQVLTVATGGADSTGKPYLGSFQGRNGSKLPVRPAFYLDSGFFQQVKLDIPTMGGNVKELIKSLGRENLTAYSNEELDVIFGTVGETPVVSGVSIEGTPVLDSTLTCRFTLDEKADPTKTLIEWKMAERDAGGGEYGEYSVKASSDSLKVGNSVLSAVDLSGAPAKERSWRAAVTPVTAAGARGETVESAAVVMPYARGPLGLVNDSTIQFSVKNVNTPSDNVFKLKDGEEGFIVLDEGETPESKYLILTKDFYGSRVINGTGNWSGYDTNFSPEDRYPALPMAQKHVAYWLNCQEEGGFLSPGNQTGLPAEIRAKIDHSHVWYTEASKDLADDYTFTAGVTLLSLYELKEYCSKIGLVDDIASVPNGKNIWWLRTGSPTAAKTLDFVGTQNSKDNMFGKVHAWNGNPGGIRPAFWLKEDFFTTTPVNVTAAGKAVLDILKTNYTEEQLGGIYTPQELDIIYGRAALEVPTISDVTLTAVSGYVEMGEQLRASYVYDAANTIPQGTPSFRWQASSAADSGFVDIPGANQQTLTIANAQSEKYIRVVIVPRNEAGTAGGEYASAPVRAPRALGPLNKPAKPANPLMDTPAEFTFQLETDDSDSKKTFILLDQDAGSSTSRFFVLAWDYYGIMTFDTANNAAAVLDKYQRFNPEKETNIAYWLKHSLYADQSAVKLPSAVRRSIDPNHRWVTEAGVSNGPCPTDYTVVSPVALLSYTEYAAHQDKIGMRDTKPAKSGWWLRTPQGAGTNAPGSVLNVNFSTGGVESWDGAELAVRPAFWLNADFFLNNRLNLDTLGETAAKLLRENYTKEQLSSLYTEAELVGKLGFYDAEIASVSVLDGTKELTNLDTAADVTVKLTLASNSAQDLTPYVLIGIYSADERLVSMNMKRISLGANGTVEDIPIELHGIPAAKGNYMQCMVWQDMTGIRPCGKAKTLFQVKETTSGI